MYKCWVCSQKQMHTQLAETLINITEIYFHIGRDRFFSLKVLFITTLINSVTVKLYYSINIQNRA